MSLTELITLILMDAWRTVTGRNRTDVDLRQLFGGEPEEGPEKEAQRLGNPVYWGETDRDEEDEDEEEDGEDGEDGEEDEDEDDMDDEDEEDEGEEDDDGVVGRHE
jgi:hypothetical protein